MQLYVSMQMNFHECAASCLSSSIFPFAHFLFLGTRKGPACVGIVSHKAANILYVTDRPVDRPTHQLNKQAKEQDWQANGDSESASYR